MEEDTGTTRSPVAAVGSFTTAAGLLLGEVLLHLGRPDELLEHVRAVHIAARATLLASDVEARRGAIRRPGVSLSIAAFGVVGTWHEGKNMASAMSLLEEVLEEMGVRYVVPPQGEAD